MQEVWKDQDYELVKHLSYLKSLSNREYILSLKYYELIDYIQNTSRDFVNEVKDNIMSPIDMLEFIDNIQNERWENIDIQIYFADTKNKKLLDTWTCLRKFCSVLAWNQNPGRNLKFVVTINGKYMGLLSFGSDIISIGERDKYIGWSSDNRFKDGKLRNIAIASTIVPMQPFGFVLTGGKFLCLLIYNEIIRNKWKEKYKDVLVGVTTTSLFGGESSQYQGMNKYWRSLGETKGLINLKPQDSFYTIMRKRLIEEHLDDLKKVDHMSGPKDKAISLYYKKYNTKDLWKQETGCLMKDLKSEHKRGVYFSRFYDNSLEFLRGEITADQLTPRTNLDFEPNDTIGLIKYWWRKFASKRINKGLPFDNQFFMDSIYDVSSEREFIDLHLEYNDRKFNFK